jgi:hypothetical protein
MAYIIDQLTSFHLWFQPPLGSLKSLDTLYLTESSHVIKNQVLSEPHITLFDQLRVRLKMLRVRPEERFDATEVIQFSMASRKVWGDAR